MPIQLIADSQGVNSALLAEPIGNDGPEVCSPCKYSRVDRSGVSKVMLGSVVLYGEDYFTVSGFSGSYFVGHDLHKKMRVGAISRCLVVA